ncbi:MAG: hypothetical protein JSV54_06065 [Chloroflexota bacterium]|nr:MAG: hypothetical protein JSV54_06065 [Chloroflexota bacterium]
MARSLEDIFNECYERIRAGESLQSCLASYPEHRVELKSLLETAFDVGRRASYIHPRPEFKHWAQVRLQGTQQYSNHQTPVEKSSPFSWLRQSWAVAVAAVLVLLLTTGSTMAASSNAMPNQTLYPIKLATEEMRLAFTFSEEKKAEIYTELVEKRVTEVTAMVNEDETEYVASTAVRLAKQMESADSLLARIEREYVEAQPPITDIPEPPVIDEKPPVIDEKPPVIDEKPPVIDEKPPVIDEEPPVIDEEPPVIDEEPPVTDEKPPVTDEKPTPSEDTTRDKERAAKWERYKKSLDNSTSKSLWALEKAKEKASGQNKSDLQKSIDKIKEQRKERIQEWKDQHNDKEQGQNNSQNDNITGTGEPSNTEGTTSTEGTSNTGQTSNTGVTSNTGETSNTDGTSNTSTTSDSEPTTPRRPRHR